LKKEASFFRVIASKKNNQKEASMLVEKLTELFCDVDDFCQSFIPQ
jgi:hypothetical protein